MEQTNSNDDNKKFPIDSDYIHFYNFLIEKAQKKKYRYVVDQINKSANKYPNQYTLHILKIRAMIKIIHHKIKKYNNINKEKSRTSKKNSLTILRRSNSISTLSTIARKSTAFNELKFPIVGYSIDKWFTLIFTEIDFITETFLRKHFDLNIIEDIVFCYLLVFEVKSKYEEKINNIVDSFSYLCIAEVLIEAYSSYMVKASTLLISIKIHLKVVKYLLENLSLNEAETYITQAIALCKKVVLYRSTYFYYLQYDINEETKTKKNLEKAYLYLSIAYSYFGIIKEHHGLIKVSIDAYKQSQFICEKFISNKYELFYYLIKKITKRSFMYLDSFTFFINEEKLLDKEKERFKEEEEKKRQFFEMLTTKKSNLKNYEEIEQKVNNITIPQIEGIDKNIKHVGKNTKKKILNEITELNSKSDEETSLTNRNGPHVFYSDYLLSNMKLIDAYLSEDFKPLINSMKQINMADLDYETKQTVQRMINKRNFKIEMEYYKKKKLNHINKITTISNQTMKRGRNIRRSTSMDDYKTSTTDNTKNINIKKSKTMINLKKNSLSNLSSSKTKKKIPKYTFAKKMFEYSKSFIKKENYLNKLNTKEINFHKQILNLKKNEKLLSCPPYSKENCDLEAEREFKNLKAMIKPQKENTKVLHLTLNEVKERKRRATIENCLLKSQNGRIIEDLENLKRNSHIRSLSYYDDLVKKKKEYDDKEFIEKTNTTALKQISQEIGNINNKEREIKNRKIRRIKLKRSASTETIEHTSNNNTIVSYVNYNVLSSQLSKENKKTVSFFKIPKKDSSFNLDTFINIKVESNN